MELPPGIVYIIKNVFRMMMILPPTLTFSGIRLCNFIFDSPIPKWLYIPLCVLSSPLVIACSILYADARDRDEAAIRGAVLVPRVPTKLPGGLDLLATSIRNFKSGYMCQVIADCFKEYGHTINMRVFWESKIFIAEPDFLKEIFSTQFTSFVKHFDPLDSLLGTGVFNSDGDHWKFHRSLSRPFFNKHRISDLDNFERHAEDAISQLRTRLREGHPADFQDLVSRFTLDSASEFLFGKDVRSLSAGLVYPPNVPHTERESLQSQFAQAFLESQRLTAMRVVRGDSWRLAEFWSDRVKEQMNLCYNFIDPILRTSLEKRKAAQEAGGSDEKNKRERQVLEGETLLDQLVNYIEDLTALRDEIFNILVAGRDTTTGTLTFVVYMLSQHPHILRRLREEILDTVGSSGRPALQDIQGMKYLRAVIDETLRLYPAVPMNVKRTVEPVILPPPRWGKPFYIPANTTIVYSTFLLHRRKDLWGEDADKFDPDRFLDERLHKYLTPNPYIFIPFNAGPRACLGQQFAYNEISYFLIRLLQTFSSISLAEDVQTLAPAEWAQASGRKSVERVILKSHMTMYVQDGLWVRMKEANPNECI